MSRRLILPLFLALFSASLSSAGTTSGKGTHYVVYLLAGQSNMDGRASVKDLTGPLAKYATPRPDILIRLSAGGLHRPLRENDGFEPLAPGFSGTPAKAGGKPPVNTFGPELSFGDAMAAASRGEKILLIKVAEGGTSLASDWNPEGNKKLYGRFIRFVSATRQRIADEGGECDIRGMLWMQGESDSKLPEGRYGALLTEFVAKTRKDLALPALPFLIGQVYDNGGRTRVIADQKAVAKTVPFTAFVDGTGLKTFDKGTHYDASSQIELGKRFATAMIRLSPPAGTAGAK